MSSPVIDPFKFKTYGVKRPLDEKEEKIQKLLEDNKRYYPTAKNGQVDEWAAVIKHQAEQHNLNKQFTQQMDKMHKNAYKKKQEQDLQLQLKHRELDIQKEYKRQQEEKLNFLRNQEQLTKMSVTNLNKRQMSEIQARNQQARDIDREVGQKMAEEAMREQRQYEDLMKLKKDTFTRQFQDDLAEKQRMKQLESQQKDYEKDEVRRMHDYNSQKQMQNQVEFRERLNKFNEVEKMKQAVYQRSVDMSPQKKSYQLSNDNNQDVNSFLKQIQDMDVKGQDLRKNYHQNTNDMLKNQMIQKEQQRSLERQNQQVEQQVQKEYSLNLNQSNVDKFHERKRQQQQYRELLNSQIKVQNQMFAGYGNMTNVEKKLNRADLLAYKSYDNKQYSLIPGIQNTTLQKKVNGYLATNTLLGDSPMKSVYGNVNQTIDSSYQNFPSINVNQSMAIDKSSPLQEISPAGMRYNNHSRNRSLRNSSVGNFRPEGNLPGGVNMNASIGGGINVNASLGGVMSANTSIANFDRQMNKERATALKYAATNILV
eukprot:403350214